MAEALDFTTGTSHRRVWDRKVTGLFPDRLPTFDWAHLAACSYLTVAADNAQIHHTREVEKWLVTLPRFALFSLPISCPRATPIGRAFGKGHDKCTRNHTRRRMWHLVQDVKQQLQVNGPWPYALLELYYTPEVTAAVQALRTVETAQEEISQLAA